MKIFKESRSVVQSSVRFAGTAALSILMLGSFGVAQAAPAAGPSDAEIAHIVVTANQIDIDAGKLALSKTKNDAVKEFAQQMVTDHSAVNKQAGDLAKKLSLTPKDNATSKSLNAAGAKNLKTLKTLKGAAFDRAYVNHEAAFHQQVLDAVDQVLLPNTKNAELKALITQVRPAFVAHLGHAKALQGMLSK